MLLHRKGKLTIAKSKSSRLSYSEVVSLPLESILSSPLTAPRGRQSEALPIGNTYIYMLSRKISEKLIHTFELIFLTRWLSYSINFTQPLVSPF
jgi:hypothetical protein